MNELLLNAIIKSICNITRDSAHLWHALYTLYDPDESQRWRIRFYFYFRKT